MFKKGMVAAREVLKDDKFAQANVGSSSGMRALFEMPEEVFTALLMQLDEEEMVWFKTKEGGRWFAKTFPTFAYPSKV